MYVIIIDKVLTFSMWSNLEIFPNKEETVIGFDGNKNILFDGVLTEFILFTNSEYKQVNTTYLIAVPQPQFKFTNVCSHITEKVIY